jgi:DNA-binding IclR family transcriptional regulator
VTDQLLPGISAVASPVFNGFGQLVLCLAAIGPSATLQTGPHSAAALCLRDAAQTLSRRLGASEDTSPSAFFSTPLQGADRF